MILCFDYPRARSEIEFDYTPKGVKTRQLNVNLVADNLAKELKLSNVQMLNEPSSRKVFKGR
jgi:hypothetical protein